MAVCKDNPFIVKWKIWSCGKYKMISPHIGEYFEKGNSEDIMVF